MFSSKFPLAAVVSSFLCVSTALGSYMPYRGSDVLYSLENNPDGAHIVAMELSRNGTIVSTDLISTEGKGGVGTTAPGSPALGSLFSSGSVVVSGNYLFTVNAGSNTVSMFNIDPSSPTKPMLVGMPADTLGDFPVSVAYSPQVNIACVLNGGAKSGVTCFSVSPTSGLKVLDSHTRSLGDALNQATPPVGPFATASQISFTPSGSALIASIKGNPSTKKQGFLYAWAVKDGMVGTSAVVSQPMDTFVDFAISFLGNDYEFFLADPFLGGVIIGLESDLSMTTLAPINVTYQKAICWSTFVPNLDTVFLIDTAEGNITSVSAIDGSLTGVFASNMSGTIDPVAAGSSLYIVDEANSIKNFNLAGYGVGKMAELVQTYTPTFVNSTTPKAVLVGIDVYKGGSMSYY